MTDSPEHERWMARALELAARGSWQTWPNPRVGALLVRDGRVLGDGWHERVGGPHAEAAALGAAGDARGATLYVSLEPCGPFPGKRTPPCAEAILAAGLARVVVGQTDPNPEVAGRSLERLRAAGLEVVSGVLERPARLLNQPFTKWMRLGLPYVTAKWAMSLDGKIAAASGDSKWITGEAARARGHALRGEVDAVLVGIGTALADDPLLTRRDAPGRDPLRVVVDSGARLPLGSRLVASAKEQPLLVAVTAGAPLERVRSLEAGGVVVARLEAGPDGRVAPRALMEELARRDLRHLMVEGGASLLGGFRDAGLIDRVACFMAPRLIGGAAAPGPLGGQGVASVSEALRVEELRVEPVGEDLLLSGLAVVY